MATTHFLVSLVSCPQLTRKPNAASCLGRFTNVAHVLPLWARSGPSDQAGDGVHSSLELMSQWPELLGVTVRLQTIVLLPLCLQVGHPGESSLQGGPSALAGVSLYSGALPWDE